MSNRRAMKKQRVEQFGWEELPYDILVNIFSRLDSEILLSKVHAVCRSWRLISRLRLFLKQKSTFLDFTLFRYIYGGEEEADKFMSVLNSVLVDNTYPVERKKYITRLDLPEFIDLSDHHLCYLAQQLPNLQILRLPSTNNMITTVGFSNAVQLWKEMRVLWTGPIGTPPNYIHVIREVGINCKGLDHLSLSGEFDLHLDEFASQQIFHHLPQLNSLTLSDCVLYKQGFEIIMNQFPDLCSINIINCEHAHSPRFSPQSPASYVLLNCSTLDTPNQWSMLSHPVHPFYLSAPDFIAQFLW